MGIIWSFFFDSQNEPRYFRIFAVGCIAYLSFLGPPPPPHPPPHQPPHQPDRWASLPSQQRNQSPSQNQQDFWSRELGPSSAQISRARAELEHADGRFNLYPSPVGRPPRPRPPPPTPRRRLRVFHGTSAEAARDIQTSGRFRPSQRGLHGRTIYFSQNLEKAKQFGPMVLECLVDDTAVEVFQDRGGIVTCPSFDMANGVIERVFKARKLCSRRKWCGFNECRQCRTEEERRAERQAWHKARQGWDHDSAVWG